MRRRRRRSPLLPVHQRHGLETGAVFDLPGHRLGALDAALGHVEGDVDAGGDGSGHQADGELPQELQGGVLVQKRNGDNLSSALDSTMTLQWRKWRRRARTICDV